MRKNSKNNSFSFSKNIFTENYYQIISLLAAATTIFYILFSSNLPYYLFINEESHLIIDQLIFNSGLIPASVDNSGFSFNFLNYILNKFFHIIGYLSIHNLNSINNSIDPLIIILENLQFNKIILPIISLLIIYNLGSAISIMHPSKMLILLACINILSLDSLLKASYIINIEIYSIFFLSIAILFICKASKVYNSKQLLYITTGGFFWCLAIFNNSDILIFIFPLLLLLILFQNRNGLESRFFENVNLNLIFLIFSIIIFTIFIIARYFKIIDGNNSFETISLWSSSFILLVILFLFLNSPVIKIVQKYSLNKNLKIIYLSFILGFILVGVLHLFTPMELGKDFGYYLNNIRSVFFIDKTNNAKIIDQNNFQNLYIYFDYALAIILFIFMIALNINKISKIKFVIFIVLLLLSIFKFVGQNASFFAKTHIFIEQIIALIIILFIAIDLWNYSNKNKLAISLILVSMICGNLYRNYIFNLDFVDNSNFDHKIDGFLKTDYLGNQVKILLALEKSYGDLTKLEEDKFIPYLKQLDRLLAQKKEIKSLLNNYDFDLTKMALIDYNKIIFENDSENRIYNFPDVFRNTLIISDQKIYSNKGDQFVIHPRFDQEIYLFSDHHKLNFEYLKQTDYVIEIKNNKNITKFFGYKIVNPFKVQVDKLGSKLLIVIKNL